MRATRAAQEREESTLQAQSSCHRGVILASASPRRSELLARMGIAYTVYVSQADESTDSQEPDVVVSLACRKAEAVAAQLAEGLILAADTIVLCQGRILGKPADEADAARMLTYLAGQWHDVYTGLCALDAATGAARTDIARTRVHFLPMSQDTIARYVATGEPMGKAGAYAIQGRAGMFIDAIEGSPSNVMGLPMAATRALLQACGVAVD